jgi:protein TIF31
MYRSLSILNVVVGDQHPDISSLYVNLGLMYQDVDNHQAAIDCFFEALYRNIHLFGDKHMNVASCYQAIALAHNNIGDYRKALEYQEKAHKILVQIYPENDPYIK